MKRTVFSWLSAVSAVAASALFLYAFPIWLQPLYYLSITLSAFSVGVITWLYSSKKPLLTGVIAAVTYGGVFLLLTYLVNVVILHSNRSTIAALILSAVNIVFFLLYYLLISRGKERKRILATCAAVLYALPAIFYTFVMCVPFSVGAKHVVGSTDAEPIIATHREYRFDRDRLLLGAYCLSKKDNYATLRQWFKEAGLDFYVGAWGEALTEEDLTWLDSNGIGVFLPNSEASRSVDSPAVWGIDLRDEPNASEFKELAGEVEALYREKADRFPLINLFPMYASSEQLGEHKDHAIDGARIDALNRDSWQYRMHLSDYTGAIDSDIISVDIYPLDIERTTGRIRTYGCWLRNLDILADACRATNRDLWVITQAAGDAGSGGGKRYCDTVEDQRWQNYVSLAFGAKALIYACYYTGWWDSDSHMINDEGERTDTYYAVQSVNREMAAFSQEYGKYESKGAFLINGAKAAGALLDLVDIGKEFKPAVKSKDPVLCGCFTEKKGQGKAFVFANMYEPQSGKQATFSASFAGAKSVTAYRKGEVTRVAGYKLEMTLENREGVFVTAEY